MQEQYTYRELSEKLDINLAKLKRWGREFLPPDYSAGQSQGVARILSIDEAFILCAAGHLVAILKYSIPETKKIMEMLIPYLREKRVMPSVISLKDFTKNDWQIKILYNFDSNEVIFFTEILLKTISDNNKEIKALHKEFDITKSKIIQHKIIERVGKQHCDETKMSDNYSFKYLSLNILVFKFFIGTRGVEVLDKWSMPVFEKL